MIPVKLILSNFTSYGENPPQLDFTKFKMAAISGQNGAGKSSLLDAITWCVWGDSRAGESSDALVRLGANEMSVEFSYELDKNVYTVKRLRSKKSGGHSSLELWSGSHNLTEGTIKATQQKIIDLLHLTYETFTNSSFIRQGNAGEFTLKGPTDRKRILADILGLDHYDKLEEKAKEKIKETQTRLTLLEYKVLEIEAELSTKEEKEKDIALAEHEAQNVEKELKELELSIKEVGEQKQTLTSIIQSLKDKLKLFESIKKEISEIKLQIELKEKTKKEYQSILDQKELIEQKCKELEKLTEQKKQLDITRSELIKQKDQLVMIQKTLNEREEKRKRSIADLEIQVREFETKNEHLEKQNTHLSSEKNTCPTCGQAIGKEKNKQIISLNEKQILENTETIKDLKSKINKYSSIILPEQNQITEKEQEIKKLEDETKDYSDLSENIILLGKYALLNTKLEQAKTAVQTLSETIVDLQKICLSKQSQINQPEKNQEDLIIFENKLAELQKQIDTNEVVKQQLAKKVADARTKVGAAEQLKSRFAQLEDLFKIKSADRKKLNDDKQIYEELALAFGKKGIQAMIIEQAIPEIEEEANRLLDRLTDGRMKVAFQTQKETKTKIAGIDGKKDYALVETLDIIISDEMGERSYELYSGGEAFRVNFAIRLAISKLLAHRAGAKLQFLVVDEGFGTQDAPGRARLVEVLDAIKNDFEKILIITHLEELKDEFPTRIEVTKGSTGSTFEVVGS